MSPATQTNGNTSTTDVQKTERHVLVEMKNKFDFEAIKKKIAPDHWRKFAVEIQVRERLHGGKPFSLNAAKAMLKARGLEDIVEAREALIPAEERAESVVDEGLCGFHRRDDSGKPGLWWPSNHMKSCIKENASVLGYNMDARPKSKRAVKSEAIEKVEAEAIDKDSGKALRGLRGALHEGLFVVSCNKDDLDWIYLGEAPDGIEQNVSHTTGPKGPQSSIKRNEFMWRPKFSFEIWIARAVQGKIHDEVLVDTLLHAQEHGIGANRSQSKGKFDVLSCVEI